MTNKKLSKTFFGWASSLKHHQKSLQFLIILNIVWGVIGIYADYYWLSSVPWYLLPFTPICSIYPPLLAIWYLLFYYKKSIPAWFTAFIFIGCGTYGILAQLYYPLYMSWEVVGINFHDVASMFWVAVYGLQTFIIASELKPVPKWQLMLIVAYFAFKDFSDYYFKTFVDFLRPGYPQWIMDFMLISGIVIQTILVILTLYLIHKNLSRTTQAKLQSTST